MYIRKRRGPNTVPLYYTRFKCSQLTTTVCSWHVRNVEIQAYVLLLMPNFFSLFMRQVWGIVSNAFEKSIMIMSTCDLLFRD